MNLMDIPSPANPRFFAQCVILALIIFYNLKGMGYIKYLIYIVAIIIVELLVRYLFPKYVKYFDKYKTK